MEFMRSAMFVPGHRQRFIDKALGGLPADVFLFDLEDGVPPAEKPAGRELLGQTLTRPRQPGVNALAQPHPLLFRDRREDRQDGRRRTSPGIAP